MEKTRYSVEFSHIYTNEVFSNEHKQSVVNLNSYLPNLQKDQYQTCILIDDYNPNEDLLDQKDFFNKLKSLDATPDYYAYEADMANYKNEMLRLIQNKKIFKQYNRYIDEKNTLPCSFMTAIWYLIRLGALADDGIIKSKKESFVPSANLINILPERFRAVEHKTIKLIDSTKYSNYVGNIDYIFFNGDK